MSYDREDPPAYVIDAMTRDYDLEGDAFFADPTEAQTLETPAISDAEAIADLETRGMS